MAVLRHSMPISLDGVLVKLLALRGSFCQDLCSSGPLVQSSVEAASLFLDAKSYPTMATPNLKMTPVGPLCFACSVPVGGVTLGDDLDSTCPLTQSPSQLPTLLTTFRPNTKPMTMVSMPTCLTMATPLHLRRLIYGHPLGEWDGSRVTNFEQNLRAWGPRIQNNANASNRFWSPSFIQKSIQPCQHRCHDPSAFRVPKAKTVRLRSHW